MEAWGPFQASQLLKGPISLRRNWNHRFLTLEGEWANELRDACAGALLKKLAGGLLPQDANAVLRQHRLENLVESQATGSQPHEGDISLVEGNNMMLSEIMAEEVRTLTTVMEPLL